MDVQGVSQPPGSVVEQNVIDFLAYRKSATKTVQGNSYEAEGRSSDVINYQRMQPPPGKRSYLCTTCGQPFMEYSDLDVHSRVCGKVDLETGSNVSVISEVVFSCQFCSNLFETINDLEAHITLEHSSPPKSNFNEISLGDKSTKCLNSTAKQKKQAKYTPPPNAEIHSKNNIVTVIDTPVEDIQKGDKLYKCSACGLSNDKTANLYKHMKSMHSELTIVQKRVMSKRMKDTLKHQEEYKSHSTSQQNSYVGDPSSQPSHEKDVENINERQESVADVNYLARVPNESLKLSNMSSVVPLLHQCSVCYKEFSDKSDLANHVKVHKGKSMWDYFLPNQADENARQNVETSSNIVLPDAEFGNQFCVEKNIPEKIVESIVEDIHDDSPQQIADGLEVENKYSESVVVVGMDVEKSNDLVKNNADCGYVESSHSSTSVAVEKNTTGITSSHSDILSTEDGDGNGSEVKFSHNVELQSTVNECLDDKIAKSEVSGIEEDDDDDEIGLDRAEKRTSDNCIESTSDATLQNPDIPTRKGNDSADDVSSKLGISCMPNKDFPQPDAIKRKGITVLSLLKPFVNTSEHFDEMETDETMITGKDAADDNDENTELTRKRKFDEMCHSSEEKTVRVIDIPKVGSHRYKCSACFRTSSTSGNLYDHMRRVHKGLRILLKEDKRKRGEVFEVGRAKNYYDNRKTVRVIETPDAGFHRYKCSACGVTSGNIHNLYGHMRRLHKDFTILWDDNDCNNDGNDNLGLDLSCENIEEAGGTIHVIDVPVKGGDFNYKCSECSYICTDLSNMYKHMRRMHEGMTIAQRIRKNRRSAFEVRQSKAAKARSSRTSKSIDNDNNDDDSGCDENKDKTLCVIDVPTKTGGHKYKCSKCRISFPTTIDIYKHMRSAHEGEKFTNVVQMPNGQTITQRKSSRRSAPKKSESESDYIMDDDLTVKFDINEEVEAIIEGKSSQRSVGKKSKTDSHFIDDDVDESSDINDEVETKVQRRSSKSATKKCDTHFDNDVNKSLDTSDGIETSTQRKSSRKFAKKKSKPDSDFVDDANESLDTSDGIETSTQRKSSRKFAKKKSKTESHFVDDVVESLDKSDEVETSTQRRSSRRVVKKKYKTDSDFVYDVNESLDKSDEDFVYDVNESLDESDEDFVYDVNESLDKSDEIETSTQKKSSRRFAKKKSKTDSHFVNDEVIKSVNNGAKIHNRPRKDRISGSNQNSDTTVYRIDVSIPDGGQAYKCSACEMVFNNTSNLHKHMRRMHADMTIILRNQSRKKISDRGDGEDGYVVSDDAYDSSGTDQVSQVDKTCGKNFWEYSEINTDNNVDNDMVENTKVEKIQLEGVTRLKMMPMPNRSSNDKGKIVRNRNSSIKNGRNNNQIGDSNERRQDDGDLEDGEISEAYDASDTIFNEDDIDDDNGSISNTVYAIDISTLGGNPRYKCSECEYKRKSMNVMNKHMKRMHRGMKIIQRKSCRKNKVGSTVDDIYDVTNDSSNTVHVVDIIKDGMNIFKCSRCDAMSNNTSNLNKHMKRMHKGMKILFRKRGRKFGSLIGAGKARKSLEESNHDISVTENEDVGVRKEKTRNGKNFWEYSSVINDNTENDGMVESTIDDEEMMAIDDEEKHHLGVTSTPNDKSSENAENKYYPVRDEDENTKTVQQKGFTKFIEPTVISHSDRMEGEDPMNDDNYGSGPFLKEEFTTQCYGDNVVRAILISSPGKRRLYKCSECELVCNNASNMYKHMKRMHPGMTVIQREPSRKSILENDENETDMSDLGNDNSNTVRILDIAPTSEGHRYKCSRCNVICRDSSNMYKHMRRVHPSLSIVHRKRGRKTNSSYRPSNFHSHFDWNKPDVFRTVKDEKPRGKSFWDYLTPNTNENLQCDAATDNKVQGEGVTTLQVIAPDKITETEKGGEVPLDYDPSNELVVRVAGVDPELSASTDVTHLPSINTDNNDETITIELVTEDGTSNIIINNLTTNIHSQNTQGVLENSFPQTNTNIIGAGRGGNVGQRHVNFNAADTSSRPIDNGTVTIIDIPIGRGRLKYKCSCCELVCNIPGNLYKHMKRMHKDLTIVRRPRKNKAWYS